MIEFTPFAEEAASLHLFGCLVGAALLPIGLAAGFGGGALNAFGQYAGMEAQSANAAYQAQIARNNAVIAERNANMDLLR
jgi:hypothetical protein